MKSTKILFTGGSGFIGKEVIPLLLKDGYEVIAPSSSDLNLLNQSQVDDYVKSNNFDIIIHSAIQGGRRNKKDDMDVFYNNMKIFENIFRHSKNVKKFINFDSGASLFNTDKIPDSAYGFSKYIIARSVFNSFNGTNLRIYGCFGNLEESDRFFSTNIKNYIEKKPIVIFNDRLIDFIYIKDFYKILKISLESDIKDIDCVYKQKYYLSDLANLINKLNEHNVDVIIENKENISPFFGNFYDLSINFLGIEEGITECYEKYK